MLLLRTIRKSRLQKAGFSALMRFDTEIKAPLILLPPHFVSRFQPSRSQHACYIHNSTRCLSHEFCGTLSDQSYSLDHTHTQHTRARGGEETWVAGTTSFSTGVVAFNTDMIYFHTIKF